MALGTDNIEDEFVINHKWDQLDFLPARRVDDEEDDDDEFESEDEIEYVVLDFQQNMTADALRERYQIEMLGLETNEALVAVGRATFGGTHEALLGHDLVISSKSCAPAADKPERQVMPFKIKHRIVCRPATIEEKQTKQAQAPSVPASVDEREGQGQDEASAMLTDAKTTNGKGGRKKKDQTAAPPAAPTASTSAE